MISSTQLMLFMATSLVLIFTPGPDIIYVMTRGVAQGCGRFQLGQLCPYLLFRGRALGSAGLLSSCLSTGQVCRGSVSHLSRHSHVLQQGRPGCRQLFKASAGAHHLSAEYSCQCAESQGGGLFSGLFPPVS